MRTPPPLDTSKEVVGHIGLQRLALSLEGGPIYDYVGTKT